MSSVLVAERPVAVTAEAAPMRGPGAATPPAEQYETLPVGLLTVDRRLQVRRANARARLMLGLGRRARAPGRRLLDRLAPQDRERLLGAIESSALAGDLCLGEVVLGPPGPHARVLRIDARRQPDGEEVVLACVDVTAASQRAERAERRALHDPLTGLPNREMALQRLEAALGQADSAGAHVGVMFVDLDRFKALNDTLGHEAGDHLLREVASRLRTAIGLGGLPARMGGDEFLVVLPRLASGDEGLAAAQRALRSIARPWRHGGHEVVPAASIGLALFPDDANDGPGLLRAADRALYRAKREGRQAARRFDGDLDGDAVQPPAWAQALRLALQRQELRLHYQPQASLRDGRLCGLGALLCWQHPQQGLLGPDRFHAAAEEAGLAPGLGAWMLVEAAGQWQRWHSAGQAPPRLAIKLWPGQLAQPDLEKLVTGTLRASGMPAQALLLEIGEEVLVAARRTSIDTLAALRSMGVGLAVDRFGTGVSSLPQLSRLRPQLLRIDADVVRDLPGDGSARAVVEAVVGIARALGVRVLADGVETPAQRDRLAGTGVDEYQGPLLGPPTPAAELPQAIGR